MRFSLHLFGQNWRLFTHARISRVILVLTRLPDEPSLSDLSCRRDQSGVPLKPRNDRLRTSMLFFRDYAETA